jgi:hypothetical protein
MPEEDVIWANEYATSQRAETGVLLMLLMPNLYMRTKCRQLIY